MSRLPWAAILQLSFEGWQRLRLGEQHCEGLRRKTAWVWEWMPMCCEHRGSRTRGVEGAGLICHWKQERGEAVVQASPNSWPFAVHHTMGNSHHILKHT